MRRTCSIESLAAPVDHTHDNRSGDSHPAPSTPSSCWTTCSMETLWPHAVRVGEPALFACPLLRAFKGHGTVELWLSFLSCLEVGVSVCLNMVCLWWTEWWSSASFACALFVALSYKVGRKFDATFRKHDGHSRKDGFLTFDVCMWEERAELRLVLFFPSGFFQVTDVPAPVRCHSNHRNMNKHEYDGPTLERG